MTLSSKWQEQLQNAQASMNLESEFAVYFLLGIFPIFVACTYLEPLKDKKSPSPPKWLRNCPMFGMRGSGGLLTGISHRVLKNLSLRYQCVQFFRVGNTDIPDSKRIEVALQHVHGVGRRRAHQIISELGIGNRLTKDLTGVELNSLREEVSKYLTGGDLRRCVDGDIKKLADIRSYRGFRHACMLPCRGQRTKTNARTMKEHKRRDKGILTRSQNLAEWMEKRQERDQEK